MTISYGRKIGFLLLVSLFGRFASSLSSTKNTAKTTVVAGATGYIGKFVVRECVRQGYNTIALVRDLDKVESTQGRRIYRQFFDGARIVECDVTDKEQLTKVGECLLPDLEISSSSVLRLRFSMVLGDERYSM